MLVFWNLWNLLEAVQLRESVAPFPDIQQVVASGSINGNQSAATAATETPAGYKDEILKTFYHNNKKSKQRYGTKRQ